MLERTLTDQFRQVGADFVAKFNFCECRANLRFYEVALCGIAAYAYEIVVSPRSISEKRIRPYVIALQEINIAAIETLATQGARIARNSIWSDRGLPSKPNIAPFRRKEP